MPAPYDYASGTGYARTRPDWANDIGGGTPITQTQLDQIDQAVKDLKDIVRDARDFGASTAASAATNTTAINAAIAAGSGVVLLGPGTYNANALTPASNVRLVGAGIEATTLRFNITTGTCMNFTDVSFAGVSDMTVTFSAQKTAGAVFLLHVSAGSCIRNSFRRLRIGSPFKGWDLQTCAKTILEDVEMVDTNAAWTQDSLVHLSGTATDVTLKDLTVSSTATFNNAVIYSTGASVDTVQGDNWNVVATGGVGLKITGGNWYEFDRISLECGTTKNAVEISGGKGATLMNVHLLGFKGALLSGGIGTQILGGEVLQCQQGGINVTGGTHTTIADLNISDISEAASGSHDGILVNASVTDVTIVDNTIGRFLLNTSTPNYGINFGGGATDEIVVRNNRVTHFTSNSMNLNGSGGSWSVGGNVPEQIPTVASAAAIQVIAPFSFVSGTTTITSITAGSAGREITLKFTGALTFTDGAGLVLAGNFVTTADDSISLVSDGTNWVEKSRSVN